MKILDKNFKFALTWIGMNTISCLSLIGLEYSSYKQIISQHSDSIICILLGYLLTDKLFNWLDKKGVK